MPPVCPQILALGSPHGDDQLAWRLAERLRQEPQTPADVHLLRSPWDLPNYLGQAPRILLLDAGQGGGVPGTVTQLTEFELVALPPRQQRSTHGTDIAAAITLCRGLGRSWTELICWVVQIDHCAPLGDLSPAVKEVLPALEHKVHQQLGRWRGKR